jgi:hypothetical protein
VTQTPSHTPSAPETGLDFLSKADIIFKFLSNGAIDKEPYNPSYHQTRYVDGVIKDFVKYVRIKNLRGLIMTTS